MIKKGLIIILIIVINIMFLNINIVQAEGITDVFTGGDSFLAAGKEDSSTSIDKTELQNTSQMIYNMLLVLGICVAVVIAAILGIKFMIGSVEEKAQVKDALIPFVIGCVVVFGAFGIWKIFVTIGNDVSDDWNTQKVANYVEVNGKLFEKGKLYCRKCDEKADDKTIQQGFCSRCHTTFNNKCPNCGKLLTYEEILEGRCHRDWAAVSNDLFVVYK